jgi:hypothetical protein
MQLDVGRFPNVSRYLASLPAGLAAFPECEIQTDSFSYLRRTHPELAKVSGLPAELARVVSGEDRRDWLPEVWGNLLYLALRDTAFTDDAAFLTWARESSAETYNKLWARALMHVISPTLIVMGAAKRWSLFHRGSTLTPEKATPENGRISIRGILSYPTGLYDELLLKRYGKAFEAAVIAAKAKEPGAALESIEPGRAVYRMSWTA